ncbi:MAG: TnpV protein [Oscillospiraceae bacterium]|jgi:hypothetical protein|nr:TnpV protein [Oscillospiraceae bacterium]
MVAGEKNNALSDPPDAPTLGYYGMKRKTHLRRNKPALYAKLLLTERLFSLCRETDLSAHSRRALGMDESEILEELVYN